MKKYILIIVVLLAVFVTLNSEEKKKMSVKVSGSMFFNSDSNFKDAYKTNSISPEIGLRFYFKHNLCIWSDYSARKNTAEISIMGDKNLELVSKQNFFSLGIGYAINLSERIKCLINGGLVLFKFEENVMGDSVSESATGFRVDIGLNYNISKLVFVEVNLGYLDGKAVIQSEDVKLGGIKSTLGIGFRF